MLVGPFGLVAVLGLFASSCCSARSCSWASASFAWAWCWASHDLLAYNCFAWFGLHLVWQAWFGPWVSVAAGLGVVLGSLMQSRLASGLAGPAAVLGRGWACLCCLGWSLVLLVQLRAWLSG